MRTTNNMLINNMMYYMTNNMDRLSKYQTQMATGKKINMPSDDPVAAARALKYRTDVSEVTQFQRNAGDATSWMDTSESVLGQLGDLLNTVYDRAVQAANDTLTPDDRDQILKEVKQLKEQAIHLANATYAGRYIFSGYSTDTKLMNDDGTYAVSVSSDKTAVIKSSLLDLAADPIVVSDTSTPPNYQFKISINGVGYQTIDVPLATYNSLDGLAGAVQTAVNAEPGFENINVKNVGGRLEFSLRETTDADGNKQAIYLKETDGGDSFLQSVKVKTEGVPGVVSSKSEDIDYQMGIGDMLKVNVLGTDLFGSGIKGDTGEFILKLNQFIDALSYTDNLGHISGQTVEATDASPLDFLSGDYSFDIQVDGGTTTTIDIPAVTYDGSGTGKTMNDLIAAIQADLPAYAHVAYQNNKIVFSADEGHEITLTQGESPDKDALGVMRIYTNPDKTITSITGSEGLGNAISDIQDLMDTTLKMRSDIGARMNRAELTANRLSSDELNFTKLMSDNEDVDMAEVIMNLTNEENVYQASLSTGARIIQPSLIDFLK